MRRKEIVVTAPRIKKQVVSTEVAGRAGDARAGHPGRRAQGGREPARALRGPPPGPGALVVWGSAPQDTRVYVDGVHVPRLYHDGGYRSMVSSDFVRSVELIPGGYGPPYGRGLGGLVTVALRPLDEEGFHGSVAADTIDAAASVRAKAAEHVHVAFAARKSWLDSVLRGVSKTDVSQYVPVPRYWDGQARVVVRPRPARDDRVRRPRIVGPHDSQPHEPQSVAQHEPDHRPRLQAPLLAIRAPPRGQFHHRCGPVVGHQFEFARRPILGRRRRRSPMTRTCSVFVRDGADRPRSSCESPPDSTGKSSSRRSTDRARIGFPPREGDVYVFGQAPPSQVSSDAWKTVVGSVGAYVEGDFSLFDDTLHVVPGARFEPYVTATNRQRPPLPGNPNISYTREEPVLEPRVSVRYAFTPRISAKAAYGVYHQAPQPEDMSAQFGTPTLELSTAEHWLAGGTFQLTDLLSAEVTGFVSTSDDLVVRSQSDSPYIAQALDQNGIGRSYGTQFSFDSRSSARSSDGSATAFCAANGGTRRGSTGACSTTTRPMCSRLLGRTISARASSSDCDFAIRRDIPARRSSAATTTRTLAPSNRSSGRTTPSEFLRSSQSTRALPSGSSSIEPTARSTWMCRT